jgi:hypothetical protein
MKTTSEIIPFPTARRIGFVRNMARVLATYSAQGAERTLRAQLNATRNAMLRKGIRPDVAGREVRSLELAIRAKLWAIVMQGGDAA